MDVNKIINELNLRVPSIVKGIKLVKFQYCASQDFVALFYIDTIFYTDRLFLEFNHEEQLFIVAHEAMHFMIREQKRDLKNNNKNEELLNYVEDAWINQLLIKLGLTPPKDVVLIEDALNYSIDELYKMYLLRINEVKSYFCPVDIDSIIKK
ncbi:MAG: hypothetical protein J6J17_00530 [Bacilli bacterium]|nr:hypothetical protein [Bacilli bacterium]